MNSSEAVLMKAALGHIALDEDPLQVSFKDTNFLQMVILQFNS